MGKKSKNEPAFPKKVYVKWDGLGDGETPFLLADTDADVAEHGQRVAIYTLASVCRMRVSKTLDVE